jgi:hypothetical protein
MTPYFDPRFLLLLLVRTSGTARAWEVAQQFATPWPLNELQRHQIEVALVRRTYDADMTLRHAARRGLGILARNLGEGVLVPASTDWAGAFAKCHQWLRSPPAQPPAYGLLHLALAVQAGASHLLSLEKGLRHWALQSGLQVLPAWPPES